MFLSKEGDEVKVERWAWVASYDDGSGLSQFDFENEKYHYFAEIEQEKVKNFALINRETGKVVNLDVPKGAKLIHFYDNIIQQPLGGTAIHHRVYWFGYELGDTKRQIAVLPNDFVVEGEPDKLGVV